MLGQIFYHSESRRISMFKSVDSACQKEACETESTLEDSFLDQQSISDESDAILALGLSREDSECDSDFYSDSEFD